MTTSPSTRISSWDKASFGLLFLALAIGFLTFKDYGLSWDYEVHDTYGRQVWSFLKTLGADKDAVSIPFAHHPVPMRTFGPAFEIFVNIIRLLAPGDYYEQKQLATFLFGLIGVAGTVVCGRLISNPFGGFLSGLFILLYPAYYGHSFINHKDLPVAVAYIWFLAALIYSLDSDRTSSWKKILYLGVSFGTLLAIRAGMFFAAAYIVISWITLDVIKHKSLRKSPRRIHQFFCIILITWGTMCILWPYALVHPIKAPLTAIGKFSSFPWSLPMFFQGGYYLPSNAPWHYIPTWLLIQIPEYLLFALGLTLYCFFRSRLNDIDYLKAIKIGVLLLAIVIPIGGIIITSATIYDAVRHLTFTLPVISVLGATGFSWWLSREVDNKSSTRVIIITILVGLILLDIFKLAALHPYQYIFANYPIAGGTERASQRYEMDYWATCTREAVSWIFSNYPSTPGRDTVISGWADTLQLKYSVESLHAHRTDFRFSPNESDADLYITTSRFRGHIRSDRLVNVISRDGAKLCYIFAKDKRP